MPEDISADQVIAAEEYLVVVKETGDAEAKVQAMQSLADLRAAFRQQEVALGRRSGLVGGDAGMV